MKKSDLEVAFFESAYNVLVATNISHILSTITDNY